MADEPLIPPLDMERPIRTDVILEDDEIIADLANGEEITEQDIQIEIEPEMDEEGNTIIAFGEDIPDPLSDDFYRNLAEEIDQRELSALASNMLDMYHADKESRSDWERTYSEGLSLLGMETDDRSEPFQGASGVYHPLLSEAVAQFQSSAYKELLPAGGPVNTRVVGCLLLIVKNKQLV